MSEREFLQKTFENTVVNFNGSLIKPEDATISIFDRGFLYGDSIYEVTRSYDGKILYLDQHIERFFNSAKLLSLKIDYSHAQIKTEVEKTFKALNTPNAYLRFMITRGVGEIGLDISKVYKNNLVIIGRVQKPNPETWYKDGVHFIISSVVRNSKDSLDPMAKSGNYLNSILAYIEAKEKNAYDAIMLNKDGFVTEGTTNNIWMVKGEAIYTAPLSAGILKGITRDAVFEICSKNNIKVIEAEFTPIDLKNADECFFTSSIREVVPISKIDDTLIGKGKPGELTLKVLQLYQAYIKTL